MKFGNEWSYDIKYKEYDYKPKENDKDIDKKEIIKSQKEDIAKEREREIKSIKENKTNKCNENLEEKLAENPKDKIENKLNDRELKNKSGIMEPRALDDKPKNISEEPFKNKMEIKVKEVHQNVNSFIRDLEHGVFCKIAATDIINKLKENNFNFESCEIKEYTAAIG